MTEGFDSCVLPPAHARRGKWVRLAPSAKYQWTVESGFDANVPRHWGAGLTINFHRTKSDIMASRGTEYGKETGLEKCKLRDVGVESLG